MIPVSIFLFFCGGMFLFSDYSVGFVYDLFGNWIFFMMALILFASTSITWIFSWFPWSRPHGLLMEPSSWFTSWRPSHQFAPSSWFFTKWRLSLVGLLFCLFFILTNAALFRFSTVTPSFWLFLERPIVHQMILAVAAFVFVLVFRWTYPTPATTTTTTTTTTIITVVVLGFLLLGSFCMQHTAMSEGFLLDAAVAQEGATIGLSKIMGTDLVFPLYIIILFIGCSSILWKMQTRAARYVVAGVTLILVLLPFFLSSFHTDLFLDEASIQSEKVEATTKFEAASEGSETESTERLTTKEEAVVIKKEPTEGLSIATKEKRITPTKEKPILPEETNLHSLPKRAGNITTLAEILKGARNDIRADLLDEKFLFSSSFLENTLRMAEEEAEKSEEEKRRRGEEDLQGSAMELETGRAKSMKLLIK